jgi:hypothetical protein
MSVCRTVMSVCLPIIVALVRAIRDLKRKLPPTEILRCVERRRSNAHQGTYWYLCVG